jgi:hypothetical protein
MKKKKGLMRKIGALSQTTLSAFSGERLDLTTTPHFDRGNCNCQGLSIPKAKREGQGEEKARRNELYLSV